MGYEQFKSYAAMSVDHAEWDESQHPRSKDGKFGSGGGTHAPGHYVRVKDSEGGITMVGPFKTVEEAKQKLKPELDRAIEETADTDGVDIGAVSVKEVDNGGKFIVDGKDAIVSVSLVEVKDAIGKGGEMDDALKRGLGYGRRRAKALGDLLKGSKDNSLSYEQLNGIEIFGAGKHNGDDYSEADLDEMVRAFGELDFKPPLKAGHSKDTPGMPALGWVENVRRSGSKLVADFVDLPKLVYDAIKDKRYNTVSAEVYWNLERGGKAFKRALKAVALLGAEIPAVANLRPLHEMFTDANAEVRTGEEVKLYAEEKKVEDSLNKEYEMTEQEMKALSDRIDAAEKATAEEKAKREVLEKQFAEAEAKAKAVSVIKEEGDDLEILRRKLAGSSESLDFRSLSLKADAAEKKMALERAARETLEKQLAADGKRYKKLEEDLRQDRIARVSETCRIPALRTFVTQFLDLATRETGAKVYDAENKEQPASLAVEAFVKYVNANAARLFLAHSSEDLNARRTTEASKELADKARAYATEHKVPYLDAMRAVVQTDSALKDAYAAEGRGTA